MQRQSFAAWRLPRELDGVLLLEDRSRLGRWTPPQERHVHDELELHFVERGHGVFELSTGRLEAPSGTLVWVPAGRPHLLLEATDDFKRWMLLCRPRLVQRVVPAAGRPSLIGSSARETHGTLPPTTASALKQVFGEVRADRSRELPLVNASVSFALARAWLAFASAPAHAEPAALHPGVARAVKMLREPGSRPTMPLLAERAGLTEAHLSKLFSAQLGVTITEYRNRVGIERFLSAYGDGTKTTLLDAALEAGFGSYAQFHRVFRKQMGYGPAEHRARGSMIAGR